MSKTPEELAHEWSVTEGGDLGFLAGYKAAQDKYEAEITELKTNFTFCCGDKARLLQELAAKEASHYKVL